MHIGKVKLLFTLLLEYLRVLLAEIVCKEIFLRPLGEFLLIHHDGGRNPGVSHLCSDDVAFKGVIVFYFLLQVLWALQIQRILL